MSVANTDNHNHHHTPTAISMLFDLSVCFVTVSFSFSVFFSVIASVVAPDGVVCSVPCIAIGAL
ncbi:MAG: hypothetical protein WCL18_07895 [bacterium]